MKILYFLAHPNNIGGAMKVLLTQANIMQMNGHNVMVVIQDDENGHHIEAYEQLCEQYNLVHISMIYSVATCFEEIDIQKSFDCVSEMIETINKYKPDIVHSVQLNVSVEMAARACEVPHLMNAYPCLDDMFTINWMNVYANYHCCDSKYYSQKWARGLSIQSECIRVAYDGGDSNKQIYHDRIRVICIATMTFYKNQLEIIKFIQKCLDSGIDISAEFIGHDKCEYSELCKKYSVDNNLCNSITFVGEVVDVLPYLQNADILIHDSCVESYPGVLVEAMANQIPIIVNPAGGIPEIVQDQINGFVTKGTSYECLYEAFLRYLDFKESGKLDALVKNGYETYLRYHSYNSCYKQLYTYYCQILNNTSKTYALNVTDVKKLIYDAFNTADLNCYSKMTMSKLFYIYHIKQVLMRTKATSAVVWGAGKYGAYALEWCKLIGVDIIGYIDEYKTGMYLERQIYTKNEGINKGDIIIVAICNPTDCEEIMIYLRQCGKKRNIDYFMMSNNPCFVEGKNI